MEEPDFNEVDDYEEWLKICREHHPEAIHNKPGTPGHITGYGEAEDEEFVQPNEKGETDMQAGVVGVWSSFGKFGWYMT